MSYIPEKSVVETFGTWKGRIKIKTQDSERELCSDPKKLDFYYAAEFRICCVFFMQQN